MGYFQNEREIIKMFFGIGENAASTLEMITKRFKLTRERVCQIKENAIKHPKKNSKPELLSCSA